MSSILKELGNALILCAIFACFTDVAIASRRANTTLKIGDAIDSPNWTCDYMHKANLVHEPDGSVASIALTIAHIHCDGKNADANSYADFHLACITSSGEKLPDIKDCVRSSYNDLKKFSWDSGVVSKTAKKTGADKYGRKCSYNTPDKKARIAYRVQTDGTFSVVCASPLACDNFKKGPKHWIVACKAAAEIPQKDGTSIDVCPQPADCVEDELPLAAPHANSELAIYSKAIAMTTNETVAARKKSR